jgi:hypothetical protein
MMMKIFNNKNKSIHLVVVLVVVLSWTVCTASEQTSTKLVVKKPWHLGKEHGHRLLARSRSHDEDPMDLETNDNSTVSPADNTTDEPNLISTVAPNKTEAPANTTDVPSMAVPTAWLSTLCVAAVGSMCMNMLFFS